MRLPVTNEGLGTPVLLPYPPATSYTPLSKVQPDGARLFFKSREVQLFIQPPCSGHLAL